MTDTDFCPEDRERASNVSRETLVRNRIQTRAEPGEAQRRGNSCGVDSGARSHAIPPIAFLPRLRRWRKGSERVRRPVFVPPEFGRANNVSRETLFGDPCRIHEIRAEVTA